MEFSLFLSLGLIVILIYWSGWISSAETALFSLPSHKVKVYKTDHDPRRRLIAELLAHPRNLLVTVFMINTFVNIVLQNVASDMFGEKAGWLLKVGVPLIVTLVIGEIIPKYIGLQNNISIAYRVAPTIDKLQRYLSWIRQWIVNITTPVSRVMFFFLRKEKGITKEEIEHILETSAEHGILNREEAELLSGYLKLQEGEVKEIMRPKEEILYYDIDQPLTKLIYLFVDEAITRIPICQHSIDNVLGIITSKDFFLHQHEIETSKDLIPYLQKTFFIPETTSARLLLKRMEEHNQILALVVDEYGSISGLISREDLIELVVGNIEDPYERETYILKSGENEVISSGKWDLADFNEYFNAHLESPTGAITIGGWLTEKIGDIPKSGTKYEFEGFLFDILLASPTRINRLFIRKLTPRSK